MPDLTEIAIRLIEPGDSFTGLSLGNDFAALRVFIKKHARPYQDQGLARTYGVFTAEAPQKLIAYITLVCGQIELQDAGLGDDVEYRYAHFPAVKIARLAVDTKLRGQGIGEALVSFALGVIKTQICPWVGCRFVVVDAKQTAIKFYESRCGFTLLDTDENKESDAPILFMDLYKIRKSIEAE